MSRAVGVSVYTSVQSIITRQFGYIFLKQQGIVFLTWVFEGHTIKIPSSLESSLIQVVKMQETWEQVILNLNAKSSTRSPILSRIKTSRNSCSRVRLLEGPYLASEFNWWVYATVASVVFSPFQYCICFALTSIHETIFSNISGDGKPVNTLTQLSRSMWWNRNATWRSKLAWVDWSTWQADMCFVNCLPATEGFSFVAAKISLLTALLFSAREL